MSSWVVVDQITKYVHFFSPYHPFKESRITTTFMEIVQKLHGILKIIISDRDPIFTRNFWTELFSCFGTKLAKSSSYHPQSNGQTETLNKFLEGYLHFFASNKQTKWFKWFPLVESWYNTYFHAS